MDPSRLEIDLPNQMAHLDIEMKETPVTDEKLYCLRKRNLMPIENNRRMNRRVKTKPQKICVSNNSKEIEECNKTMNTVFTTLETIYEEPKVGHPNTETYVGRRKLKRLINCQIADSQYTKDKIKKRRAKIKKLFGEKSFLNRKKVPMDMFLNSIKSLELDEAIQLSNHL